jgi:hypothetical protein
LQTGKSTPESKVLPCYGKHRETFRIRLSGYHIILPDSISIKPFFHIHHQYSRILIDTAKGYYLIRESRDCRKTAIADFL